MKIPIDEVKPKNKTGAQPRRKPIVFFNASHLDRDWCDRIRGKLIEHSQNQIEYFGIDSIEARNSWNANKEAIEHASIAIVMLSPDFLNCSFATQELVAIGARTNHGQLTLVPVLLRECSWMEELSQIRGIPVWSVETPLTRLSYETSDRVLKKLAIYVVQELLKLPTVSTMESNNSSSASSSSDSEDEVQYSENAQKILSMAKSLAERSARPSVTSSCLLFAFAECADSKLDTTKFVRNALAATGKYDLAFEGFLNDSANVARRSDSYQGVLSGDVSSNVYNILQHARRIVEKVSSSLSKIHSRHLFASLLVAPDGDRPRIAWQRFVVLGIDLPKLCVEFLNFILAFDFGEDENAWREILAIPPNGIGGTKPAPSGIPAEAYRVTYTAFVPDRADYARGLDDTPLDDALGVGVHAGHLAQLIAAKKTSMPLSIGLFGAWGSGKSYFMDLLDEHLRKITHGNGNVFHQNIIQIRFNAWHYLDTNLWANLVCEIFDQLFAQLGENNDSTQNLKAELAKQSALAAEAQEALNVAQIARKRAESELGNAVRERVADEEKVGALLDDLKSLVRGNKELKEQLRLSAEELGLPKLETSFAELEARAGEVRSLGGRTKAIILAIFASKGWWNRTILLVAALGLPLAIGVLAQFGSESLRHLFSGIGGAIAQIVAAIMFFSSWLSVQIKVGSALVNKLEKAYDEVKKVRAKNEAEDQSTKNAQAALAASRRTEAEARHRLQEAESKLKTIQAELAEMAPGRQLIRFLKERASAEDYRRHLGLVSLVRRDFEQLSLLLMKAAEDNNKTLPQINRIVLYIDDLDRCRADRVIEVLEAVHLLLAFPLFAVVVAVDPRWLRQSLLDHYPRLLGGTDGDQPNARSRAFVRPATPHDYLEKIFQVPFHYRRWRRMDTIILLQTYFPAKNRQYLQLFRLHSIRLIVRHQSQSIECH